VIVDYYEPALVAAFMVRSGRDLCNEDGKDCRDTMREDPQHDEATKVKLALCC